MCADIVKLHKDYYNDILDIITKKGTIEKNQYGVRTYNSYGYNKLLPSFAVKIIWDKITIPENSKMLVIGPAYGLNAIPFMLLFPYLDMYVVEPDKKHVDILTFISNEYKLNNRLTIVHDIFPSKKVSNTCFDLILFSKILHFYPKRNIAQFLKSGQNLLKNNGCIVTIDISNKVTNWVKIIYKIVNPDQIPIRSSFGTNVILGVRWKWIHHFCEDELKCYGRKMKMDCDTFECENGLIVGTFSKLDKKH